MAMNTCPYDQKIKENKKQYRKNTGCIIISDYVTSAGPLAFMYILP